MTALQAEQLRALDKTRLQLLTLRNSLAKLQENIATEQPLPSVSALQVHSNVLSNSLREVAEHLARHQELFNSIQVFPLPTFPGQFAAHILTDTLLRTKLEPNVEEWVEQGEKYANEDIDGKAASALIEGREQLWNWAPRAAAKEFGRRHQFFGADYTLEEVKNGVGNVNTGLTRKLFAPNPRDEDEEGSEEEEEYEDDDEEEDDEDDSAAAAGRERGEDKMDVERAPADVSGATSTASASTATLGGRPAYLETMQEYMTTGRVERYEPHIMDRNRELASKKQAGR